MKKVTKRIIVYCAILALMSIYLLGRAQDIHSGKNNIMESFKEKRVLLPETNFTGIVHLAMNIEAGEDYNTVMGTVFFEPKARTNWHTHTCGQILIVTKGLGYYQEKGKPVQLIKEGDIVKIPKDVDHWHGASHSSAMDHVAIVPKADTDKTEWLSSVTDKQYDEGLKTQISPDINLSEAAIKNHEELWPNYEWKEAQTDPELIEIFDNWAFDELISYGNIDTKTRVMMILGSTIAQGALTEYKMFVDAALNVGVSPVEIKEVLYQSVAYVGIAKVIDFIYTTNVIFQERGIALPLEKQSTTTRKTRYEKGLNLMKTTFGERIDEMRENAPEGQKHIQDYLAANCFGDYYTRTGLDLKTRELLTYSMLISMGGTESQVKGHIQGNLNVGNDKEILLGVTTQLLPYIGYPRCLNAVNCINEVCK